MGRKRPDRAGPQTPGSTGAVSSTPATTSAREALGTPGDTRPSFWSASIGLQETYSNNVNLNPSNVAKSAFVTEITPFLGLRYLGPRASLVGDVSLPVMIYAPSDASDSKVYPTVNLLGDVTLVDDFLFLEGAVNVSQQFFSPFGAQPISLSNSTGNRYRSTVYRFSPFIKGRTGSRDRIRAAQRQRLDQPRRCANQCEQRRLYERLRQCCQYRDHSRLEGVALLLRRAFQHRPAGHRHPALSRYGNLYGHGVASAFGERGVGKQRVPVHEFAGCDLRRRLRLATLAGDTSLGDWEHRYFGSSYRVAFERTTPLSQLRFNASRNVTTYPQQIASLPSGVNVAAFLNALFLPAIGDATQRQQFVDQLIRDRGLPGYAFGPGQSLFEPDVASGRLLCFGSVARRPQHGSCLGVLAEKPADHGHRHTPSAVTKPWQRQYADRRHGGMDSPAHTLTSISCRRSRHCGRSTTGERADSCWEERRGRGPYAWESPLLSRHGPRCTRAHATRRFNRTSRRITRRPPGSSV